MYGLMPGLLCKQTVIAVRCADAPPQANLSAELGKYIWTVAQVTLLLCVGNGCYKALLRKSMHLQTCHAQSVRL